MKTGNQGARNYFSIVGWVILTVLIFIIILIGIYISSLFKTGNLDTGIELIAAIVGLTGILGTTTVTLLGILLKASYDNRSQAIIKESEERLRMETAIQALNLMSEKDGRAAPKSQYAGALFALASLGQLEFALSLLSNCWTEDQIDSASAVWLIDKALTSESAEIHDVAAEILLHNSNKLTNEDGGFEWPRSITMQWTNNIAVAARVKILTSLLRLVPNIPKSKDSYGALSAIESTLYPMFIEEDNEQQKLGAALGLRVLVPLEILWERDALNIHDGTSYKPVFYRDIEHEVNSYIGDVKVSEVGISVSVLNAFRRLLAWAELTPEDIFEL